MKKENIFRCLYAISLLLMVVFITLTGMDWWKYDEALNSAPFYIFVVKRVIELVIPSIVIFIIARIIKKKYSK